MAYVALYREWRPKTFSDIIGQEHITRTLKNQITQGRVAHAYLFCGTRGTGKTTTAKVFAKAVNCLNPRDSEPCGHCEVCMGIDSGSIMDVFEIDAASNNGVDNIRELRDDVKYPPSKGKYKVYIIDEVHMLSTAAFNALLKTLEEPPAHVIFILATTEFQKVPATILSRCQRFDFKRIKASDVVSRLRYIADEYGINVEDKTLKLIARNSDGAMRDALSIFDQCISAGGKDVSYEDVVSILGITTDEYLIKVTDGVAEGDTARCISLIDELIINGKDVYQFIKDFTLHFRNLLISRIGNEGLNILNVSEEMFEVFKKQSMKFSTEAILRNINILSQAEADAKWASQPRIILEMAAIRMCKKELHTDMDSLLDRISRLEKALASGSFSPSARPAKENVIIKEEVSKGEPVKELPGKTALEQKTPKKAEAIEEDTSGLSLNVSLQEISKKWGDILKAIKADRHMTLYAYMMEGKPAKLSNGVLTVSFAKEYLFNKNGLDRPENRAKAEEYIFSTCGYKIRLKCVIMEEEEVAADAEEDDFIEKTISIFGSDIVEVEE